MSTVIPKRRAAGALINKSADEIARLDAELSKSNKTRDPLFRNAAASTTFVPKPRVENPNRPLTNDPDLSDAQKVAQKTQREKERLKAAKKKKELEDRHTSPLVLR